MTFFVNSLVNLLVKSFVKFVKQNGVQECQDIIKEMTDLLCDGKKSTTYSRIETLLQYLQASTQHTHVLSTKSTYDLPWRVNYPHSKNQTLSQGTQHDDACAGHQENT